MDQSDSKYQCLKLIKSCNKLKVVWEILRPLCCWQCVKTTLTRDSASGSLHEVSIPGLGYVHLQVHKSAFQKLAVLKSLIYITVLLNFQVFCSTIKLFVYILRTVVSFRDQICNRTVYYAQID